MISTTSDTWKRRGFSLLWDPSELRTMVEPAKVVPLRTLFSMQNARSWPEILPGSRGNALVVAGLDGCLGALSEDDAVVWLRRDVRSAVLAFQDRYEGQAALILWLAEGKARIGMNPSREEYYWRLGSVDGGAVLPLGNCLWGGADEDVCRILLPVDGSDNHELDSYVGLYHARIS